MAFFLQILYLKASAIELLEVMLEDTHVDTPERAKVSLNLYNYHPHRLNTELGKYLI